MDGQGGPLSSRIRQGQCMVGWVVRAVNMVGVVGVATAANGARRRVRMAILMVLRIGSARPIGGIQGIYPPFRLYLRIIVLAVLGHQGRGQLVSLPALPGEECARPLRRQAGGPAPELYCLFFDFSSLH